jgi:hypothetical protein
MLCTHMLLENQAVWRCSRDGKLLYVYFHVELRYHNAHLGCVLSVNAVALVFTAAYLFTRVA